MNQYGNAPYYPTDAQQNQQQQCFLHFPSPSSKHAEFIHDKCNLSIYVLDNSGNFNYFTFFFFGGEVKRKSILREDFERKCPYFL
jgi:hypothetical protein